MCKSGSAASILGTLLLAPDLNSDGARKQRGAWFQFGEDHSKAQLPSLAFQGLKAGVAGPRRQCAGALRLRSFPVPIGSEPWWSPMRVGYVREAGLRRGVPAAESPRCWPCGAGGWVSLVGIFHMTC